MQIYVCVSGSEPSTWLRS